MAPSHSIGFWLAAAGCGILSAAEPPVSPGARVYEQNCANCHYEGKGNPAAPDLIGSPFWSGGPKPMITLLLRGQSGVSVVNGKPFNGQMPPMDYLTNEEIAAVTAYVLKTFGKQAVEVSPATVASIRAEGSANPQPPAAK